MRPEVVVSIPVHNLEPEFPQGTIFKEFRLDYLSIRDIEAFIKKTGRYEKCIVTIRDKEEGGHYTGDVSKKLSLLRNADCGIVDIEYRHLEQFLNEPITGKRVIFSVHNFEGEISPDRLEIMLDHLPRKDSILKAAMKIQNVEKYLDLSLKNARKLLIVDMGSLTNRILFALISGTYLYSSYRETLAPNQPSYMLADLVLRNVYG